MGIEKIFLGAFMAAGMTGELILAAILWTIRFGLSVFALNYLWEEPTGWRVFTVTALTSIGVDAGLWALVHKLVTRAAERNVVPNAPVVAEFVGMELSPTGCPVASFSLVTRSDVTDVRATLTQGTATWRDRAGNVDSVPVPVGATAAVKPLGTLAFTLGPRVPDFVRVRWQLTLSLRVVTNGGLEQVHTLELPCPATGTIVGAFP